MRTWVVILLLCLTIIVGNAPGLIADASGAPACEPRSTAHTSEHGGLKADSAWHVSRGERPTCDPDAAATTIVPAPQEDKGPNEDDKSRYCRRKWFC